MPGMGDFTLVPRWLCHQWLLKWRELSVLGDCWNILEVIWGWFRSRTAPWFSTSFIPSIQWHFGHNFQHFGLPISSISQCSGAISIGNRCNFPIYNSRSAILDPKKSHIPWRKAVGRAAGKLRAALQAVWKGQKKCKLNPGHIPTYRHWCRPSKLVFIIKKKERIM